MNIFVVDLDPSVAARSLCDRHVVKMLLESAQMLCHIAHKYGIEAPYKDLSKKHHKHPCVVWSLKSKQNCEWLTQHALELCREYTARYNKRHKSQDVIEWFVANRPNLPDIGLTPFALAIKVERYAHLIKPNDPVRTYRDFYMADKAGFATWKRNKPDWYTV